MNKPRTHFSLPARLLHWLMAAAILAMLFIGAGMVSTVSARYPALLALHRPLGIIILALAVIRLGVRAFSPPPPLPADLPSWQKAAAGATHWVLYGLMLALPLVGWAMQSAGDYPVTLAGHWHLPPLLAPDLPLYARLRALHRLLAYSFFLTILGHLAAALFHGLVRRDGVLSGMVRGGE